MYLAEYTVSGVSWVQAAMRLPGVTRAASR